MKVLVAYFSATGGTAKIAQVVKNELNRIKFPYAYPADNSK